MTQLHPTTRRHKLITRVRYRHTRRFWSHHDRATYTCPGCGRSHEEVDQLEVHHRDHDPLNGHLINLIGLCRRCHYTIHGRSQPMSLDDWKDAFRTLGGESA